MVSPIQDQNTIYPVIVKISLLDTKWPVSFLKAGSGSLLNTNFFGHYKVKATGIKKKKEKVGYRTFMTPYFIQTESVCSCGKCRVQICLSLSATVWVHTSSFRAHFPSMNCSLEYVFFQLGWKVLGHLLHFFSSSCRVLYSGKQWKSA